MSSTTPSDEKNTTTNNNNNNNNNNNPTTENQTSDESIIIDEPQVLQQETAKHFNEMMSKLGDEYFDRVTKLAEQNIYNIGFKIPTGKKIKNPVTDKEEDEFSGWESKTFRRGRITSEEYKNIELLRGRYNKEKDQEKNAELFSKLYQYIAYVYLGMNFEDIRRADWDELKPVLDACNFGTVYSMKRGPKPGSAVTAADAAGK